jgi:hypothetical protein
MLNLQSYAEFVLGLYEAQLNDCALQYPALAKEFKRDFVRLSSAVESHGVKFLLGTLAAWRKHFDVCLSNGRLTRSNLLHSSSWKKGGTVPKLFRGLVLRVFDLDGTLKVNPDVNAIRLIRQLTGAVRKMKVACSKPDTANAVREFVKVDHEVRLGSPFWDNHSELDPRDLMTRSIVDDSVDHVNSKQDSFPALCVSPLAYRHAECIQQV